MNRLCNILVAATLTTALTPAFADDSVRLTGSTAFRALTHTALTAATPTGLGFTQVAFTGTSASGAKYAIYERGISPNKTTLKTSWTGSAGGVQAVVQQRTDLKWLPDVGTSGVVAGSGNAEALAATDGIAADIAFSDSYQASTPFPFPTLTDTIVGVVQFRMVTNYGVAGANPITSMSYQQARALFTSATGLPLSFFTGNAADTTRVYGVGRNADSGTRITFLSETGVGANASVIHWQPATSGTAVTSLAQWPAETLFDINYAAGNSGYESGGDLARIMRYDTSSVSVSGGPAAPCYFVALVGKSDAATVLAAHNPPSTVGGGPGKIIKLNNEDTNALNSAQIADSIKNGQNPLWSYLHMLHNGITGSKLTFYSDLGNLLKVANSSDIVLSQMRVERTGDGETITAK
jgi:hypothetical protein